ncbi:adenylate kinase [candidate division KSB1 bacterium]|nr:adenylate kinase [candidate division KSB1 bacterium]
MRLILLGAPGTGKGTQGNLLALKLNVPKISTGDILRQAIEKKTSLGIQAQKYMQKGDLVPDEIIIGIVKERLEESDCKNGFILDGFPRTVPQAIALDTYIESKDQKIDAVIALEVERDKLVKRLTSRRVCKNCGNDYNIITNPPPEDMKCTKCGGEIIQRADDNEEIVVNRLQVYEEKTFPLKEYYTMKGNLKIFDGDGTIEDIQRNIQEYLAIE